MNVDFILKALGIKPEELKAQASGALALIESINARLTAIETRLSRIEQYGAAVLHELTEKSHENPGSAGQRHHGGTEPSVSGHVTRTGSPIASDNPEQNPGTARSGTGDAGTRRRPK